MTGPTLRFEGFEALDRKLQGLGDAVARDLTVQALREGAELIQREAQNRAPKRTGLLALAIKVRVQKVKAGLVSATIGFSRGTGRRAVQPFYALFLEETGARPHTIKPRKLRAKQALADAERGMFFGRKVRHPGFRARPFLRPALDEKGAAAVRRTGEVLWQKVAAFAARGRP